MKPSNTIIVSPKYIEEKERQIAELSKKVERLQEQLADADKLLLSLKHHAICDFDRIIYGKYIDKWGVK